MAAPIISKSVLRRIERAKTQISKARDDLHDLIEEMSEIADNAHDVVEVIEVLTYSVDQLSQNL